MMKIKDVIRILEITVPPEVKGEEWQRIRRSLVGQWAKRPYWCCSQLRKYLGNIRETSDIKLRIVMNYLIGTGFRTGRIKHDCISTLRNSISNEIKRRKVK